MNSSIILQEVYSSLQANKIKAYDDLNRLLSRPEISSSPVEDAKKLIAKISKIENQQEITLFFNEQLSSEDSVKVKDTSSDVDVEEDSENSTEEEQ